MKRLLTLVAFFATLQASAQQVNPVPDYVFANRMSAGRNTVTDTAAYLSIGPRYGATRGMMPPMVVDTASFSANKRNGLLIFSVQKNKFLYWDSVGVKWAEMAGTGGSAITGSGVAGYMPEFTTATNLDTTRLYHSAGRFAIGSTTTSNGVFNVYGGQSYFDTSLKVGSQTLLADEGKNEVYVNTTSDAGAFALQVNGSVYTSDSYRTIDSGTVSFGGTSTYIRGQSSNNTLYLFTNSEERVRLNAGGEFVIGNITDAGDYKLQVYGNFYNSTGGSLAASSGNVGIGTLSPETKLQVNGTVRITTGDQSTNRLRFFNQNTAQTWDIVGGLNAANNTDLSFYDGSNTRLVLRTDGEVWMGYTSDQGSYLLQANGNALINGTIRTAAPAGGTANDWRLGTVATVSPTSPNRTIEVSIAGTIYYIHAKTTND